VLRTEQPVLQAVEDAVQQLLGQPGELPTRTLRAVLRVAAQRTHDRVRQPVDEGGGVDLLQPVPVGVDGGVPQPAGGGLSLLHLRRGLLGGGRTYEVLGGRLRLALDGLLGQAHRARVAAGTQRAEAVRVLHGVQQLVGEQALAVGGAGAVGALAEEDVLPDRHRVRAQQLGQLPGVPTGVQPYAAEVVTELLLQLPSYAHVERLSGAADDVLRFGRTGLGRTLLALAAALFGGLFRTAVLCLGVAAHGVTSPRPESPACTARASSWPSRRADSPAGS
jgi:hypothetical protein